MSVFSECFDTNSDAEFEKNECFDEISDETIIDRKNEKNEINKVFDCDADFELSNKKIIDSDDVIDSNDVKNEIKKIDEFEIIDFDFFA